MMAQFAVKKFGFEKVIFIPAYIPPHKELNSNLAKHRFNMVKLATENNLRFSVSDIEYKSEGKSYTLITVKKIREQYGITDRLNMIIGTDAFKNIKSWYETEELKDLVHFIVFPRGNDVINSDEYQGYSYELVDSEKFDVSSTEIRKNAKVEEIKEVKEYITKNELYD
jgi:nicotinate-nucleotide adenylyltransferase